MQTRAAQQLRALFPDIGPWTSAALWHGLDRPAPAPTTPLADEIDLICAQRLAGLLLRYLRDAAVTVAPEHREQLQRAAFAWAQRTYQAMAGAVDVLRSLEQRGVPVAVSKGPGITRFYPSAECRPFSDIDLLGEERRFNDVTAHLEAQGWREEDRNRQPWNYFRRLCREGLNLVQDATGAAVDLHHRVPPWIWSRRMDTAGMIARSEPVDIGANTYRCLAAADNLVVVALHLVSDHNAPGQTLLVWRDLVQLARAAAPDDVVRIARAARLDGWLYEVLSAVPEGVDVEAMRLAVAPPARVEHPLRLWLLLSRQADRLGVVGTQVLRLPLLNGLAFVAGMTIPSRAFLRRKYPTTHRRYLRWWSNGPRRLTSGADDASG